MIENRFQRGKGFQEKQVGEPHGIDENQSNAQFSLPTIFNPLFSAALKKTKKNRLILSALDKNPILSIRFAFWLMVKFHGLSSIHHVFKKFYITPWRFEDICSWARWLQMCWQLWLTFNRSRLVLSILLTSNSRFMLSEIIQAKDLLEVSHNSDSSNVCKIRRRATSASAC